jgi:hypothetical protein
VRSPFDAVISSDSRTRSHNGMGFARARLCMTSLWIRLRRRRGALGFRCGRLFVLRTAAIDHGFAVQLVFRLAKRELIGRCFRGVVPSPEEMQRLTILPRGGLPVWTKRVHHKGMLNSGSRATRGLLTFGYRCAICSTWRLMPSRMQRTECSHNVLHHHINICAV